MGACLFGDRSYLSVISGTSPAPCMAEPVTAWLYDLSRQSPGGKLLGTKNGNNAGVVIHLIMHVWRWGRQFCFMACILHILTNSWHVYHILKSHMIFKFLKTNYRLQRMFPEEPVPRKPHQRPELRSRRSLSPLIRDHSMKTIFVFFVRSLNIFGAPYGWRGGGGQPLPHSRSGCYRVL